MGSSAWSASVAGVGPGGSGAGRDRRAEPESPAGRSAGAAGSRGGTGRGSALVAVGPTDGVRGGVVTAGWPVAGGGITTGPTEGVGMNGVLVSGSAVLPTVAEPALIAVRIGMDAVPASRATVKR